MSKYTEASGRKPEASVYLADILHAARKPPSGHSAAGPHRAERSPLFRLSAE